MKIVLIGANGKMGKTMQAYLDKLSIEHIDMDVDSREEITAKLQNDADTDVQALQNGLRDRPPSDYIVIDFSSASCLKENLSLAKMLHAPIIIATTNHSEENLKIIKEESQNIAVFMSANFSIMFNILLKCINNLAALENNCDFILTEIHHKTKIDSPSGSAKKIIKNLQDIGKHAQVVSLRAGDVVGVHELQIISESEMLELKHSALSREVFCEGALRAAIFMQDKNFGLFSMDDLIGVK